MKKIVAVIPARYQSSRFPGKPLSLIAGKTMIQRVYDQVRNAVGLDQVIVATDDERIYKEVQRFQGISVMTRECSCGTERVYEAIRDYSCDIVINVQGDEPLINPEVIGELISGFMDDNIVMVTLCKEIVNDDELSNPNIVKVVRDKNNDALYFSRYPIPFNRDGQSDVKYFKHIGVYGYTKDFLKEYVLMEKSSLEIAENLEQLRVLQNGYSIKVIETSYDSIGVDMPEDIMKIEREIKKHKLGD